MIGVMDLGLWDLSDNTGIGSDAGYGESDFSFRYVPDIIEENAINEKSCVEVLNHLIAKADTEILDLEDDLAILQSQLSWAEHEKLYEECIIVKADIEELEQTTAVTASFGFSRKPDNKQIIGTDNQVLDNDIKGESFSAQGELAVNGSKAIILFQQDGEGKGETEQPTLRAPLPMDVKVDFDENETLAVLLSSQGSKRKKLLSNPTRSRIEIAEESNQNLCINDMSASAVSKRNFVLGKRNSPENNQPLHTKEDPEPASNARSQLALSAEVKNPSMSCHSRDLQGVYEEELRLIYNPLISSKVADGGGTVSFNDASLNVAEAKQDKQNIGELVRYM
ncbi:hypothetical protein V2J09_015983 [Rumex salicifolius]